MNTKQKVFNLLKENKKRELSKKVDLGLIDNFAYDDLQGLEDDASNLEFYAYDWFDDAYYAAIEAWQNANDVLNNGAANQIDYADVQRDEELLAEIATKADELGLAPQEVYDQYDEHLALIKRIEMDSAKFEENRMKFDQYFS
tara:strand:+ start:328 stop:756 length:429 start_codon:yes stop_codon:yes gene_type:complete